MIEADLAREYGIEHPLQLSWRRLTVLIRGLSTKSLVAQRLAAEQTTDESVTTIATPQQGSAVFRQWAHAG